MSGADRRREVPGSVDQGFALTKVFVWVPDFQRIFCSCTHTLWQFQCLFCCIHLCLLDAVTRRLRQAFSTEIHSNCVYPCICRSLTLDHSANNLHHHSRNHEVHQWHDTIRWGVMPWKWPVRIRITGSCIQCPGNQNALKTNCVLEHINLQLASCNSRASALFSWCQLHCNYCLYSMWFVD